MLSKDVDPDEISTLKAARDNSSELSATLEKLKESYSAKESELATQTQKIKGLQVEQVVNQSVNEYNTLYPEAFGLNTDAVPLASMLLKQAMKVEDDNSVKVYNSKGEVLVTDKGAGTPVDFIESLRAVHPSMFKQPQGSGAKGSASSKGGDNTLTRSEFEALPVAKKAEVARTHTITD